MSCNGSGKTHKCRWCERLYDDGCNCAEWMNIDCPGCDECQYNIVEEGATGIEHEDISGYCYDCGKEEPHTCKGKSNG